jgi:CRISPR-associated protein Csh2
MNKRGFLFLYETSNSVPNGDPFTGEQRIDMATQKIQVSDVRIKRFIRDKMIDDLGESIYVDFDQIAADKILASGGKKEITGSALAFRKQLVNAGVIKSITDDLTKMKKTKEELRQIMLEFIDVRLFGGVITEEKLNQHIQGAVQFSMFSNSLNSVRLENRQTTTVFPSKISNAQGSIGTSSYVPYSIINVVGWLDNNTAVNNNLTEEDIDKMQYALWLGINRNSQSKAGSSPLLSIEIIYKGMPCRFNPKKMIYSEINHLDSLVSLNTHMKETEIRNKEDYTLDFSKLIRATSANNVEYVNFFTQDADVYRTLVQQPKFKFKDLLSVENVSEEVVKSYLTAEALSA